MGSGPHMLLGKGEHCCVHQPVVGELTHGRDFREISEAAESIFLDVFPSVLL